MISGSGQLKILYVFADNAQEWNCSQWRCLTPSDSINRSGKGKAQLIRIQDYVRFLDFDMQRLCNKYDVHVLERNVFAPAVWHAMDYWRGMGKAVVAQWDDAYQLLPASNPAHPFWIQNTNNIQPPPLEGLKEALRHADAFVSPNKLILKDWERWAHATYWLPNFADDKFYREIPESEEAFRAWLDARLDRYALQQKKAVAEQNKRLWEMYRVSRDRVIIGYGSSMSHYDSWMGTGLREACRQIAEEYPQVLFRIHGNDRRFYDLLPVPDDQKQHVEGVPPEDWPKLLAQFDIGLAPLSGDYDQRRSWLKVVEYMLVKVPWVASGGVPYAELTEWSTIVDHDPEKADERGWYLALKDVIEHLDEWREFARGPAYEKAQSLTMDANAETTLRLYDKVRLTRRNAILPGITYAKAERGQVAVEAR